MKKAELDKATALYKRVVDYENTLNDLTKIAGQAGLIKVLILSFPGLKQVSMIRIEDQAAIMDILGALFSIVATNHKKAKDDFEGFKTNSGAKSSIEEKTKKRTKENQ